MLSRDVQGVPVDGLDPQVAGAMSARVTMMGMLATGLGHDLGNLLLPMRLRLDSLARGSLTDEQRADVQSLHESLRYLGRLSRGLRHFALHVPAPRGIDLPEWWPEAGPFLRMVLPRSAVIEGEFPAGLPKVGLSAGQLTQVVFNLVQNSGAVLKDRADGRVYLRARGAGTGVRVVVGDNGPGISPEARSRLFQQRPDGHASGRGLGLWLVRSILHSAGGDIALADGMGPGAVFELMLPAVPDAPGAPDGAAGASARVEARTQPRRPRTTG